MKHSQLWINNHSSRNPSYTMRQKLLPKFPPVASFICMHTDRIEPLKIYPDLYMNWETGLIHHKGCNKPILESVRECWGCEWYFWGTSNSRYCEGCE